MAKKQYLDLSGLTAYDGKIKAHIDSVLSNKSDSTHNHDDKYDEKGAASSALTEAKAYADDVKDSLLNGAGTAYDTLLELGNLIDDNTDAIEALETVASNKADATHSHIVSDVTDLTVTATELNYMDGVTSSVQAQLDSKSSVGKNVTGKSLKPSYDTTESAGTGAEIFNDYSDRTFNADNSISSGNVATGSYSHAEGNKTTASGWASHAEGLTTTASGMNGSHAEGCRTTASGMNGSHAEGWWTIARGSSQHAQGKYNIEDIANRYAHIVGNGDADARSNAHTLDWDGNAWYAGDIYVGGASQDDVLASKLISEADQKWNLLYDSGEISAIANSISNIDVSGYTNIQVLVRCYNDGDSINSRAGSAIFTCENGKTYQFPVWSDMFSKSINTVYVMGTFKLVDGWLVCPYASRLIGDADTFDVEGGTAGNLTPTGSGVMKCTSSLSTLTISNLDQNSNYYFGMGSRVMVWGWNA